jgi:putative Mg2+ transporter-C (MgtC) family protein
MLAYIVPVDLTSLHLELLIQLLLAVLLGGAIGIEREMKGKPAGLRTNILICMAAVLFTSLSIRLSQGRGDPARLAAQILTGVGFIGAGTILHTRGAVTGLTSAATIWVVTAIGIALGSRAYVDAMGTTVLVMLVLAGLGRFEDFLARQSTSSRLIVHARPQANTMQELESLIRRTGLEVVETTSRQENVDLVVELTFRGSKRLHEEAMIAILHHPLVRTVSRGE